MQLDISDIRSARDELIRLLRDYRFNDKYSRDQESCDLILSNGRLEFQFLLKKLWKQEIQSLLKRDSIQLYHVCRQDQEQRILTYEIFHDESPTLSPSLIGAIAHAEDYHVKGRDASILMANVPTQNIEFCYIDNVGPGFLPLAQKTRDQIPQDALPYELVEDIFDSKKLPAARWLDPKCFNGTIHRASNDTVRYIFDHLKR